MQTKQIILLSTIYTVLLMLLLSLDGTYTITHTLFGSFIGNPSQETYGTGMRLKSPGFIIHLIIFAILLISPMLMCNER